MGRVRCPGGSRRRRRHRLDAAERELVSRLEQVQARQGQAHVAVQGAEDRLEISRKLVKVVLEARAPEHKVLAFLGLLAAVGGGAVAAGAAVDNPNFGSRCSAGLLLAMAGLCAYAAEALGIFAEMVALIRL
jgi:hypothetical protein